MPYALGVFRVSGKKDMKSKGYVELCLSSIHPGADPEDYVNATCHVVDKLPAATTDRRLDVITSLPFLLDKALLADPDQKNNIRIDILLIVTDCNRVYRGEHLVSPGGHTAALKTIFGWVIQ